MAAPSSIIYPAAISSGDFIMLLLSDVIKFQDIFVEDILYDWPSRRREIYMLFRVLLR
jgi:hypothetical protein